MTLNLLRGSLPGRDRRTEERHLAEVPAVVTEGGRTHSAWLVEVSRSGARLVIPRAMEEGDEVGVALKVPDAGPTVKYLVRYGWKLWEGAYEIGAELCDRNRDAGVLLNLVLTGAKPRVLFKRPQPTG